MLISRKRCKTEIYLQWKSNRISYMAYQMAATAVTLNDLGGHPMTLKVIHRLQAFSNAICRTFVQHFNDFNWQCARAVPMHYQSFLFLKYWCDREILTNSIENTEIGKFWLIPSKTPSFINEAKTENSCMLVKLITRSLATTQIARDDHYLLIRMHARPEQTDRQTDGRTSWQ